VGFVGIKLSNPIGHLAVLNPYSIFAPKTATLAGNVASDLVRRCALRRSLVRTRKRSNKPCRVSGIHMEDYRVKVRTSAARCATITVEGEPVSRPGGSGNAIAVWLPSWLLRYPKDPPFAWSRSHNELKLAPGAMWTQAVLSDSGSCRKHVETFDVEPGTVNHIPVAVRLTEWIRVESPNRARPTTSAGCSPREKSTSP